MAHLRAQPQAQRPQTSSGAFMRKGADLLGEDDFDKELDEMILKNQQRLAEL